MSSSIAASLGLTRPRKRTTPILESGEFVAPPPTSFASPLVIGTAGTYWQPVGEGGATGGRQRDADEESLFELEEFFVDGIRAVGTPNPTQGGGGGANAGDESDEEDWPTIKFVGGVTAPNTPKAATSSQMSVERSVTPKASRLMRIQTIRPGAKFKTGGTKEKDIGTTRLDPTQNVPPDLGALVSEAMGRGAQVPSSCSFRSLGRRNLTSRPALDRSVASLDKPFIGRSISYCAPPVATPASLVPAATMLTPTPLPVPVPPTASPLGVSIPLTMPLNVPHRQAVEPAPAPPPPLPPKSPIRLLAPSPLAITSPLASPTSNPSPLSSPGRERPSPPAPNGYVLIQQPGSTSHFIAPVYSNPVVSAPPSAPVPPPAPAPGPPTPLSTPGREDPPTLPTVPPTSAQAAQLHATMVAAAVAAATAQIERTQSATSSASFSTSSSETVLPATLQPGGAGVVRKPVPAAFPLSNSRTTTQDANGTIGPSTTTLSRQLTLPQMVVTDPDAAVAASGAFSNPASFPLSSVATQYNLPPGFQLVSTPNSIDPHRSILPANPLSIPLSRYGTRSASANPPRPVSLATLSRSSSTVSTSARRPDELERSPPAPSRTPSSDCTGSSCTLVGTDSVSSLESLKKDLKHHLHARDESDAEMTKSASMNRSSSSLALLAPLTKFPDPAFPRRPLVLSEHLERFRASSATSTASESLWNEATAGEGVDQDGRTTQRRKILGTVFKSGRQGAPIKWVGKDGLLGEDESWTVQKWGLVFSVATLLSYGLAAMVCAFSTYLHSWQGAEVAVAAETGLLTGKPLTVASFFLVLTSLLGLSGTLLNSRPLLAVYAVLLWPCLAVLLVVGYVSYRRAHLNLESKVDEMWSRALSAVGRKLVQDEFKCCGYYNSYHDATFSATCFPRSNLPGCKGALVHFETHFLRRVYRAALGLVPLHLVNITIALLCANHVDRQFGKGLMPRQYRLRATDFSPLLLPTLSRTFPSLPSPHAPTLQRHATHRSTSSMSSFASTRADEDVVYARERGEELRERQDRDSGGIRMIG